MSPFYFLKTYKEIEVREMIHSDWHIHSEASYDASLPLTEIVKKANEYGFYSIGITDHANLNDDKFLNDLHHSVTSVKKLQITHPEVILGVELTPIAKPEYDYMQKHGNLEGYIPPQSNQPFDIELACTKEELVQLGVRYAIGASHWRVDVHNGRKDSAELKTCIKEWYRQQMWLACDERVTILGHPWYHGRGLWYADFSVIPHSMNEDIAHAVKENGKYMECNSQFFHSEKATEKFRHQYAEFLREMFEMGIPITYGSDSHNQYKELHHTVEKYLSAVGFQDGDIVGLSEESLW